MDRPKTKPVNTTPRVLKKTVRTVKGLKSGVEKTVGTVNMAKKAHHKLTEHMPSENEHHRPEEYMTDKISEKASYSARKVGGKATEGAKKLAKKGVKKALDNSRVKKKAKNDEKFNADVKKEKQAKTKDSYKTARDTHKSNVSAKTSQKHNAEINMLHTTDNSKRIAKDAIHTGKKTNKTVKASKKTMKSTKKAVKTTKKGVKTAAKTAKISAKAAKKAAVIAKRAAVLTAKAIKYTVKAVIVAVKVAIAAIKGLIALIAAGGWIVIIIILIIAVIMLIISSPFGVFTNDTDGTTPTISEVVQEINEEYITTINNIVISAGDVDEVIVEGETASSDFTPTNWIDVLGVFSVKSTMNDNPDEYMDVLFMDDIKIESLKEIFWQMNSISYEIQEEMVPMPTSTPSPIPNLNTTSMPKTSLAHAPTPEIIRTLIVTMEGKTYEQGAEIYSFTDEQQEILEELMSPYYISLYMELCGMDTFNGLTSEQLSKLVKDLPQGELGSVIVEYASTRLGHPYSQEKRGQGNYVDCSYFARWCYQQVGITTLPGTAAAQARYCIDNGLTIAKSDLQIGDLIFWSFNTNGRFMNVTHVGIYAGAGYVIDASSSRGMVVYRPIFGERSIVACGRPHVK